MTATSPMISKRFGVRCKSGAGIVPFIWSRRFISGYVGFLGDKSCVCGIFCWFMEHIVYFVTTLDSASLKSGADNGCIRISL